MREGKVLRKSRKFGHHDRADQNIVKTGNEGRKGIIQIFWLYFWHQIKYSQQRKLTFEWRWKNIFRKFEEFRFGNRSKNVQHGVRINKTIIHQQQPWF